MTHDLARFREWLAEKGAVLIRDERLPAGKPDDDWNPGPQRLQWWAWTDGTPGCCILQTWPRRRHADGTKHQPWTVYLASPFADLDETLSFLDPSHQDNDLVGEEGGEDVTR